MRTWLLSWLSLGILGAASVAGAQPPPAQPQPAQPAGQPGAQPSANDPAMNMNESDMGADDEQARAHFRVGRQRYQDGEFTQAAREFQEAYNLSRRPALLYNVYVAWRDGGDLPHAAEALRGYLAAMPPTLEDRAALESRLRGLDAEIARSTELQAQADEARRQAEEQQRQREAAEQRAREEEARRREAEQGDPTFGWILTAGGGALLAASAVTGVIALNRTGDIEDHCPMDVCEPGFDLEKERNRARVMVRATDVLWIAGAAVAATGLVLVLLSGGSAETEAEGGASTTTAGAMCTTDGCAAEMQVRF